MNNDCGPRRPGPLLQVIVFSISLFLGAALTPTPVRAGPVSITQSFRWLQAGEQEIDSTYIVSYTSLSSRSEKWSIRGSLSWVKWDADVPVEPVSSQSGFGAIYLTGGRRIWDSAKPRNNFRTTGWIRLRAKIPLEQEQSALGSGKFDWGASLFSSTQLNRFLVFVEVGFLELGDPVNISYKPLASASLSMSYRPRSFPLYPLASFLISSSSIEGASSYSEISGGFGCSPSKLTSLSIIFSKGLTSISPRASSAIFFSIRI